MEIKVYTKDSSSLKSHIIDAANKGELNTWGTRKDKEGDSLLTHTPEQWYDKVVLKFTPNDQYLGIKPYYWNGNKEPTEDDYGYILGRFTEILLARFRDYYTHIEIII